MLVLSGLRWFDYRMKQEQHRVLCLTTERHELGQEAIRAMVQKAGYAIIGVSSVACNNQTQTPRARIQVAVAIGTAQCGCPAVSARFIE
jgi:hypothetical protein